MSTYRRITFGLAVLSLAALLAALTSTSPAPAPTRSRTVPAAARQAWLSGAASGDRAGPGHALGRPGADGRSVRRAGVPRRRQPGGVQGGLPAFSGSDTPSFLVVEHGHFTVQNSEGLDGSPTPTGSVLTLAVDAATGRVTDYGVQSQAPLLSGLGAARSLTLR